MNEAEKANPESDVYLKEVRLKNYKSIIDAEIDFKPGLNIIIGNNGSGKTNFLVLLINAINFDFEKISFYETNFSFFKDKEYSFFIEKNNSKILDFIKRDNVNIRLVVSGKKEKRFKNIDDAELDIERWALNYKPYFLKFGIPSKQQIVDIPFSISYTFNGFKPQLSSFPQDSLFSFSIYFKIIIQISRKDESNIEAIESYIKNIDNFLINISTSLSNYTDIKYIRISPNFNIYFTNENKKVEIKNLYLEFNVNNEWIPYDNLSDGTKRLFYIISEITSYDLSEILDTKLKEKLPLRNIKKIFLLEEPELGIHPHQLHKLMLFIKEQSKEKQIILTTHSPQVLNILDADELDRIIICNYDQQKGTQLRHLTEKEMQKARLYMQEDFLSDYWIHSDLEPIT